MKKTKFYSKNAVSKLMLLVCAAIIALSLNSCSKDKEVLPGQIPGLGNTPGELTGTPFTFPDGVELDGEITGAVNSSGYWSSGGKSGSYSFIGKNGETITKTSEPATRTTDPIEYRGSGKSYVELLVSLRNTKSTPITVTIPAATVFVSKAGDCQNGVLIKKVSFTIPANSTYKLCLVMYCGNASKGTAGSSDIYILGVVSNAAPLLDLCERVKNKKINIEEFPRNYDARDIYRNQANVLQDIVWNVTDGDGITSEDIAYINSLPNS